MRCEGTGDFRPLPCGRDNDHSSHDVGLPPGSFHDVSRETEAPTLDVPPTGRTLHNVMQRRREIT